MEILNYRQGLGAIFALSIAAVLSQAQTYTVIKHFNGTNGTLPSGTLAQGLDGNFYGTAESGGSHSKGTVFKLTPAGALTTIYNFCANSGCPDGSTPMGGVTLGANGEFFGTTQVGGAFQIGTIFRITTGGALTTMHSFCASSPACPDGAQPIAGLTSAIGGNLFGTALDGGSNGNAGTVFKITPNGRFTTLHSFCASPACGDGSFPYAGLSQAPVTDGVLYGMAETSGAFGRGTIFKITPNGVMTTLYSFCAISGCPDGSGPTATPILGNDGNLYGTTINGGTGSACTTGCGTVFMMTPVGMLTTLHNFDLADGSGPLGLVLASDGNFYGTTEGGGTSNKGTIFQVTPGGTLTTLHSFSGEEDEPLAGLMQAIDGNFYGASRPGGTSGNGAIYRLSMGLSPIVKNVPANGSVGTAIKIIGTSLTGTSSVTFNGTAAAFTVVSATEISVTVPAGATSGPVHVTTPGGTLASLPFAVLQ